jgi:hypothetical protein
MKGIKFILIGLLGVLFISCGNQTSNRTQNNFSEFMNAHDGVEFKSPSIVQSFGQQYNQYQTSDIVLTLDSNRTYHLRAQQTNNGGLNIGNQELEGVRGTWEVTNLGVLKLKRNGQMIAESNTTFENSNNFNLHFHQDVQIEMLQFNQNIGFNGGLNSFQIVNFTLGGTTVITR